MFFNQTPTNMETAMKISLKEFKEVLAGFTGTEHYYLHHIGNNVTMKLTDGCQFIRQYSGGGAYWLFDIILSWQLKLQNFPFQIWKLMKQSDGTWVMCCTDGNEHVLAYQEIGYSDFPIDTFETWLVDGVCLLPSEY